MENVWKRKSLCLMLFCIFALSALRAQEFNSERISADLLNAITQSPSEYHSVYLMLSEQVALDALEADLQKSKASLEERAYRVITALQNTAAETQPVLLETLKTTDGIRQESIQAAWITNAVFFEANARAIAVLSWKEGVGRIAINHKTVIADARQEAAPASVVLDNTEPGLAAIGATQMWAMGYTGYGRKAFVIDDGQDAGHPALRNQFAFNNVPLNQAWTASGKPQNCEDHGTHVTGILLGLDRRNEDTIGVAFDAQWMGGLLGTLVTCNDAQGTVLDGVQNMQWALNPDGNANTIDDMPDVVNNSWGSTQAPTAEDCFGNANASAAQALHTAGVAVVWSAGNNGPGVSTIGNPPMINTSLVRLFSVANINANSPGFNASNDSSRGPSVCGGTGSRLIKPEVSAPGSGIRSGFANGEYGILSGTSMAAPHASGAVLLLKEAFPYLPGDDLLLALYFSAIDLGPSGEDNTYGMGLINVPAAYQYLIDEGHEPVPPASRVRDAILLDIHTEPFNCSESLNATVVVENNGSEEITSLDITHSLPGGPDFQHRWEGNIPVNGNEVIALPAINKGAGTYTYQVRIRKVNGEDDPRPLNNRLKKEVVITDTEPLAATVVGNRAVCSGGNALLRSNFEGVALVRWYTAAVGGELIAEGKEALVSVEGSPNRTLYMEVSPLAKVGKEELPESGQRINNITEGLKFDVHSECVLRSVKMYAEEAGNRLLTIEGPSGGAITKIVTLAAGENRVPINQRLQPGEGYELRLKGGKPVQYDLGLQQFPFEIPNILTITGSTAGSINYFYFYDWEVEYAYICGRTPVEIEVQETAGDGEISFQPANAEIDLASGLNDIAFSGPEEGITLWAWNFGDGQTSSQPNPIHAYTDTGTYRVTLTVVTTDGCTSSAEGVVVVTESDLVAVKNVKAVLGLKVFPNPAKDLLYLSFTLPQPIEADIFLMDMLGRQLLHRRTEIVEGQAVELSVSQLPAGMYWITLLPRTYGSQGDKLMRKVLITR